MVWSRVQSAEAGTFGTAVTTTFTTANVTAGNKIIAYVTSDWSDSPTSVQDAAANAWTLLGSKATGTGSAWLYALDVPAGDAGTKPAITATFPSGNGQALLVQEVSGLLAGSTTAMTDGTPGTLSGTAAATGSPSYSSASASEYLICMYGAGSETTVPSGLGGAWTTDPASTGGTGGGGGVAVEYGNSTGGAETSGFTGADTSGWAILTVAFRLAAGVSFTTPNRPRGQAVNRASTY